MKTSADDLVPEIQQLISDQRLGVGAQLPSERQLAREWGVSHSKVNRAVLQLLGTGVLVREGYRLYVGVPEAAKVVSKRLHFICPVPRLIRVAEAQSTQLGVRLVSVPIKQEGKLRKFLLELLHSDQTDGILIWKNEEFDFLDSFEAKGVPIVCCGRQSETRSFVAPDFYASGALPVQHLFAQGHRHLAFLSRRVVGMQTLLSLGEATGYQRACMDLGLKDSALRVDILPYWDLNNIRLAWKRIHDSSSVSAVVCYNALIASRLALVLKEEGMSVPRDVSLVCCNDSSAAITHDPPLTAVHIDDAGMASMALLLLISQANMKQKPLAKGKPQGVHFQPQLQERYSIAAPPEVPKTVQTENEWTGGFMQHLPEALEQRQKKVRAINARRFKNLPALSEKERLQPLDISGVMNRGFRRQNAWLGSEPLLHLSSGLRHIHGIPFAIVDEKKNHGKAALILRSGKARSSGGILLPTTVRIPVSQKVEAVYFLHACGWIMDEDPFAEYHFIYANGKAEVVSVMAYGRKKSAVKRLCIVQDWHSGYPQPHSKHALPFVVTDSDPLAYSRFVYVYEWINPHPEWKVEGIELRSLNPERIPTLAVLGVTVGLSPRTESVI